jgi:hypothetical protein
MIAALLAASLLVQEPFGAIPSEVSRTSLGRFTLIERNMRLPDGPQLHGPRENWTELRLEFRSGEDRYALVDNGRMLLVQLEAGTCSTWGSAMGFAGEAGEPGIFRDFTSAIAVHDLGCPMLGRSALNRHRRELRAARGDFAAGIEMLKRRAETVYRGGWRCRTNQSFGRPRGEVIYLPNAQACGLTR